MWSLRAKQSILSLLGDMDCFASLAMTLKRRRKPTLTPRRHAKRDCFVACAFRDAGANVARETYIEIV